MNETILVVDDEDVVLGALRNYLELKEYNVITAASGEEALDILSGEDIDLIILDINMPNIDGKKIFTAVKEIEPEVPIIIITGMAMEDGESFARESGAEGFLKKPINEAALYEMASSLIAGQSS